MRNKPNVCTKLPFTCVPHANYFESRAETQHMGIIRSLPKIMVY